MTTPICLPDLSPRPFRLTVERAMAAPPDALFRAWTEQFDRWFAAPGSVLMKGEVVMVGLTPKESGTRLRLTHAGFPDEESRNAHYQAWTTALMQLDQWIVGSKPSPKVKEPAEK